MRYLNTLVPQATIDEHGRDGHRGPSSAGGECVAVGGVCHRNAISADPAARLVYDPGGMRRFTGQAALQDGADDSDWATFTVLADGRIVAHAEKVRKRDGAVDLSANLYHARVLELVIRTRQTSPRPAVWVDPALHAEASPAVLSYGGNARLRLSGRPRRVRNCIFTVVTPAYEKYAVCLLRSLDRAHLAEQATVCVLAFGITDRFRAVLDRRGVLVIEGDVLEARTPMDTKLTTTLIPHAVYADRYVYLDADMLLVGDMGPLLGPTAIADRDLWAALQSDRRAGFTNRECLLTHVGGMEADLRDLGATDEEAAFPGVINAGLWVGTVRSILGLDRYSTRDSKWLNSGSNQSQLPESDP